MNQQSSRTLIETRTTMAPADVLGAAKQFFALRPSIYAAFVEKEGPTYVNLRGQGGVGCDESAVHRERAGGVLARRGRESGDRAVV